MKNILVAIFLLLAFFNISSADEIVCIQCHREQEAKFSEPVKQWKGSVHEQNGIACNACHGGDPKDADNAMNKDRGFLGAPKHNDVPNFCGRCHVGVLKDYQESGHGKALTKGGPNCVTCHSNHHIVKASLDLINEKTCTQCHTYDRAKEMKGSMQETDSMIVDLDRRINNYKNVGTDTERLEKELFAHRNRFHTLFHSVDVKKVVLESGKIKTELSKVESALKELDEEKRKRKQIGGIVVALVLLSAFVVHLLLKTYRD